jgi:hypothetical protein
MIELGPDPGDDRPRDPFDRVLGLLVRVQTPLGLLLVIAGFVAVFMGWLEASSTADVRIQMQDLISGGVGGLGMLVIGGVLLQSALSDRAARRTELALVRIADLLEPGAGAIAPAVSPTGPTVAAVGVDARGRVAVLATHASFHLPGCDLLDDRAAEQVTPTTVRQARRKGLQACRVCVPTAVGG